MNIRKALLTAFATSLASASLFAQDQLYFDLSKFPKIEAVKPNITGAYTVWASDTTQLDTVTFVTGFMKGKITMSGPAKSFSPFVPHGKWVTTYANGMSVVTEYQQGHKTGLYEFRNEKGILVTRGTFEKSHPVGTWTNYHDTGVVSSERVWRGGKVKIAAANNPQGTALVTAGNGTFSEGTTKIQVKDSMKVGTVNYTDASSGLGTFSVTYAAGGGFTVQNTEGGGSSATTTPPKMGMDQKIQFFTAPFSHASMPDPSELFPVDIEPNPLNLDQVKMSIGYPTIAKENDIQGKVLVKVLVDEKGKVACALLLRNPNPILSNAVLAKMDNLKFAPGGWEGQPTMCWVTLPFEFKLMN